MNARHRTLLQLTLALVLALGAGGLVFKWTTARSQAMPVQTQVMIAVAARDLTAGAALAPDDMRLAPCLPDNLPQGFFRSTEAPVGRTLLAALAAGTPVTFGGLAPEASASGVSAMISPGKRAIAVKGNKVLGLAGFVRPGNRVDVLVTLEDESRTRSKDVTKIVLENIRVLATGTELETPESGGEPSSVDTYTLEMTPEESERLALAAARGTLHFALRNPADTETVLTRGTDIPRALAALSAAPDKTPAKAPAKAAPRRPKTVVQVIRGTDVKSRRF